MGLPPWETCAKMSRFAVRKIEKKRRHKCCFDDVLISLDENVKLWAGWQVCRTAPCQTWTQISQVCHSLAWNILRGKSCEGFSLLNSVQDTIGCTWWAHAHRTLWACLTHGDLVVCAHAHSDQLHSCFFHVAKCGVLVATSSPITWWHHIWGSHGAPKHSPQDDHFALHNGHLVNLNFGSHAVLWPVTTFMQHWQQKLCADFNHVISW